MKVLVLSDNVLLSLARDPRLRVIPAFRMLHQAVTRGGGCRCRKRRGNVGGSLVAVKHAIANDSGLATKVKAFTRSQKLVVHVRTGNKIVRREI
jgi:hypothetical protein